MEPKFDSEDFDIYPIVNSSNIAEIGYGKDNNNRTGYVRFINGGEYLIAEMPLVVFNLWKDNDSAGKFFANVIKKSYTVTRIETEDKAPA